MKTRRAGSKNMKAYLRALAIPMTVILILTLLSGCFDRRELNTLGYVMGTAIDKGDKDGETKLTLQLANVSANDQSGKSGSTSKKEGESSSAFVNISRQGRNINEIVRSMEFEVSRTIYVPHNQLIIFGEELAKEGVRDCLDFFARAPEARMKLYVIVAKGKASDILDIEPTFEKMPASELDSIISSQTATSQIPIVTEYDFINALLQKTTSPIAPVIEIIKDEGKEKVDCVGSAVFKDNKMIGQMDKMESRGMLFIKNEVKRGIMPVEIEGVRASVEIRKAKSKLKSELKEDGSIIFKVEVEETVGIGDQHGEENIVDPKNLPAFLKESEKTTKKEIQMAVKKAKELNADVFGFGEHIRRKYPDKWKKLKDKWDEVFRDIKVEIKVKAKADGTGRIDKPLVPEKE